MVIRETPEQIVRGFEAIMGPVGKREILSYARWRDGCICEIHVPFVDKRRLEEHERRHCRDGLFHG